MKARVNFNVIDFFIGVFPHLPALPTQQEKKKIESSITSSSQKPQFLKYKIPQFTTI